MSENERDTKFQGFANLLLVEIYRNFGHSIEEGVNEEQLRLLIARRAYDLVKHTIWNINPSHLDTLLCDEIPARIPDMDDFPD